MHKLLRSRRIRLGLRGVCSKSENKDWYGPFVFRSVPFFDLPEEVWDIEHLEQNQDTIDAYFHNGPDPVDSQFLYKRTVRSYIETRFPADKSIREIIDITIAGLEKVNTRLVWGKKYLALVTMAVIMAISIIVECRAQVDPIGLDRFAAAAIIVSVVLCSILAATMSSLHSCMQDICTKFQTAFQQYTNTTFNLFKEAIFHIDQEEREVSYEEWPSRARQWFVSAVWQPYRIEYAVLYFQQAMHSAENNWNGIFGVELIGNFASGVILIAGTTLIAVTDNLCHIGLGIGLFDAPLDTAVTLHTAIWLLLVWIGFDVCAVGKKVSVEVFERPRLLKFSVTVSWLLLLVSLSLPVVLWLIVKLAGWQASSVIMPHWREYLLVLTANCLLAMTFWSSTSLDIIREKLDTQKWHQADSFNIAEVLGNQVYRDKNRINEEKNRMKDTKVEPPKRKPVVEST